MLSIEVAELWAVGERLGRLVEQGAFQHQEARTCLEKVGRGLNLPVRTSRPLITKSIWSGRGAVREGAAVPDEDESRRVIDALADALSDRRWKGGRDLARLRLIAAALAVARQAGKVHLKLAIRQWAEEAGRGKGTITKYHTDLAPWIVPVKFHPNPFFSKRPTEWIIGCPDALALTPAESLVCPLSGVALDSTVRLGLVLPDRGSLTGPDQEIHQRSIYGPLVHTWINVRADSFTVREVADALNTTPATVLRHLHRLEHFGFVERLSRTVWQALPGTGDPEALAAVEPIGWRRKAKHAQEQEYFHNNRALDLETGEIIAYRDVDHSDREAVEAFWKAQASTRSWR